MAGRGGASRETQEQEKQEHERSTLSTHHDFFDVYRVAIEDLHATKDLGQRIDSFYLTIVTLLLTADAYVVATAAATARLNTLAPTFESASVMVIGLFVTARWQQGTRGFYQIVKNRYKWLREAEKPGSRPKMQGLGADIFTHEYNAVYRRTTDGKEEPGQASDTSASSSKSDNDANFYNRTLFLQVLCVAIFIVIPAIIGSITCFTLNPDALQAIQRAIP